MLERLLFRDFVETLDPLHERRLFVASACKICRFVMPDFRDVMLILAGSSLHELDASRESNIDLKGDECVN